MTLLRGEEVDAELITVLGGRHAEALLPERIDDPVQRYWLRVWAARGLLWCWDDVATEALIGALDDDAWRVREMALKVVARHRVEKAIDKVAQLQDDPVARVRAAAARALVQAAGS
jgi:HEAT repeat protein